MEFLSPSRLCSVDPFKQCFRALRSAQTGEGAHISTDTACIWNYHLLLYNADMAVNYFFGFKYHFGQIEFFFPGAGGM